MISRINLLAISTATAIGLLAAPALAVGEGQKTTKAAAGNIVAGAVGSPDHKTLVAAVKAAGLVDTLAGPGPFTVFAPTDAAFARLPAGTVDTLLQPANRGQLQGVRTYHVVPGRVTAANLIAMIRSGGGSTTLTTAQGGTLTAQLSDGNVVITDASGGNATVSKADLMQSNGIIHVTDAVFIPR
jgi:uncharacterized surface protein with fasciclin (FAS1) repeats